MPEDLKQSLIELLQWLIPNLLALELINRPRRLRRTPALRAMVRGVSAQPS